MMSANPRFEGVFVVGDEEYLVVSTAPTIPLDALSAAERAVIELLLEDRSYREVAALRGVSRSTVSNQVQSAFRKLGVSSRRELLAGMSSAAAITDRRRAPARRSPRERRRWLRRPR